MTPSDEPPPLAAPNRSFRSFLATQGLGAFNDNVFKQVVLLLCVGRAAGGVEFQAVVQLAFALPFLLLSGLAGDLSDRVSKGRMMVLCKVAEIGVMLLGAVVFVSVARSDTDGGMLWLLAGVTFLMGSQSAFFGPAKYGGLPQLVRAGDLPRATGFTQMTTFLAIILGVAVAGLLLDLIGDRLWLAALPAIGIAGLGTWTSLGIERVPATDPTRRIGARSLWSMMPALARIIRRDRLLFAVMVLYSWFWLVGGVALPSINDFGRQQLGTSNLEASLLVSVLSVGIAAGSVLAGRWSRGRVRFQLALAGLVGMIVCLLAVLLVPAGVPADGVAVARAGAGARLAAFAILLLLGVCAGVLTLPLLTFVQARPALREKGKVFATVNWFNWVFIVGSAFAFNAGMRLTGGGANRVLAGMGVLSALIGVPLVLWILKRAEREPAGA